MSANDIIQRNAKCVRDLLDAGAEIERLRAIVNDACEVLRHYDLPEHAFHYERVLRGEAPLTQQGAPLVHVGADGAAHQGPRAECQRCVEDELERYGGGHPGVRRT